MKLEEFVGREVKLIFQDSEKVLVKAGIVKEISKNFVVMKCGERIEAIPQSRVIRIEVVR